MGSIARKLARPFRFLAGKEMTRNSTRRRAEKFAVRHGFAKNAKGVQTITSKEYPKDLKSAKALRALLKKRRKTNDASILMDVHEFKE